MFPPALRPFQPALDALRSDLGRAFGGRLRSLVAYGPHLTPASPPAAAVHTLALVDRVTFADLAACAGYAGGWKRRGLAVPLLLAVEEFTHSLDAFPLEYGDILAHHLVLAGDDPFAGLSVRPEDLRRACEVQAKSHLIHLREGYLETGGRAADVAALVAASAAPLALLVANVARLEGAEAGSHDALAEHAARLLGLDGELVRKLLPAVPHTIAPSDAVAWYPACLGGAERLWRYVDGWSGRRA